MEVQWWWVGLAVAIVTGSRCQAVSGILAACLALFVDQSWQQRAGKGRLGDGREAVPLLRELAQQTVPEVKAVLVLGGGIVVASLLRYPSA